MATVYDGDAGNPSMMRKVTAVDRKPQIAEEIPADAARASSPCDAGCTDRNARAADNQ
jgi:hypothetical protein